MRTIGSNNTPGWRALETDGERLKTKTIELGEELD